MAGVRPIPIPSGEGTALDSLFKLIPEAPRSDWSDDLAQLERWKKDSILGQSMDYAAMFWPALVECDDCIFLAARSPGSLLYLWLDSRQGNRQAVESELNSIYIGDLFTSHPAEPTRDQVIWLARMLKKMWGWKLHHEFPDRPTVVAFDEGVNDVLRSYITFFQTGGRG